MVYVLYYYIFMYAILLWDLLMGEPVFCSRQRVSAGRPSAIPRGKTAVQAAATERRRG